MYRLILIFGVALSAYLPGAVTVAEPTTTATRAAHDWPSFLGPRRNSKSRETGICTAWGENGPPIVWQRELDTSYGIGSVARRRCAAPIGADGEKLTVASAAP